MHAVNQGTNLAECQDLMFQKIAYAMVGFF
jgi:hypothetical protein